MWQSQWGIWRAHTHPCIFVGVCLNRDGRTYPWFPPLGFHSKDDSGSGAYGICRHLCVCASRHVLSEEAAMTQLHTASVYTYADMSVWTCLYVQA